MIPHKLHFVCLQPDGGKQPFLFCHWAAIRSAQLANPGWTTTVWVNREPAGKYWDAIRPHVNVQTIKPPTEVFGNPIPHVAHKCDWIRLQVLKDHGGVYLDMDTITVKGFDIFVTPPVSMVRETANGSTIGLCNAFIAAEPGAEFIHDWIEKFRGFRSTGRDAYWNEISVKCPHELYQDGGDCFVFPSCHFFVPDWTPDGLAAMFDRVESFPHAWGHHLWGSLSWSILSKCDEHNYESKQCTYATLLKRHLDHEIRSELF
jgi:hypothetical protein